MYGAKAATADVERDAKDAARQEFADAARWVGYRGNQDIGADVLRLFDW